MVKGIVPILLLQVAVSGTLVSANPTVDELPDLTEGVVPVIQYKHAQPLSGTQLTSVSEVEFIVTVKNQTGDPVVADSLILVVDTVREITGTDISDRVEIKAPDGLLANGKPFFRIPNAEKELGPYSESEAVTIRVSNPDYLRFYPPSIRVRGLRRSPGEAVKGLLESLVQKGILAPEEAANAMKSTSPPVPSDNP
ncbi:MAG: hypothetical protein E4H32_01860 [Nitrospirales bacterium]|nr:MAG: hypothetical protein E4H32_01860 [Nitrospirales bacterium]